MTAEPAKALTAFTHPSFPTSSSSLDLDLGGGHPHEKRRQEGRGHLRVLTLCSEHR